MRKKYILAIDQGTTGSRAVIYDKAGREVASAYVEFRQYFPRPGWVEHDPKQIWKSVNSAIQKVLREVSANSIVCIGISNQRETTIIWDKKTGKPIYNAIVWQCRRTSARCEQLKIKGEGKFFRKITGLPIDAYFSATKIEWILKNIKGARKKALSGELCFGTTDSWVLWKLTGGTSHATDYTNASRTMLFDIDKLKWDKRLLKKFAIPKSILPEVKESSSVFGKTVKIGRLNADIPISGIAGDQQAALFGQRCFSPGTMKNTYGTGCFVLLNVGKKRPISKHGLIITLACSVSANPVYALEGAIFVGGSAIQWLRDGLKLLKTASESEKMANELKNNAGVYFVPAFVGLGAPYWDQNARGAIYGITRGTTKKHIVRAALEAMCYQTKDVLSAMEKDSVFKIKSLKIDGGVVVNNFLCQFQADILQVKVIRPQIIETTSLGAAYLAGLAIGYYKMSSLAKNYQSKDKIFKPKMSKEDAAGFYNSWLRAVKRTRSN